MLLLKYYMRDYDAQMPEVKADIYLSIKAGYEQSYLSANQVTMLVGFSKGYTIEEIAFQHRMSIEETKQLLCAAFQYLETATGYYDRSFIYARKQEVKPEWLLKCAITAYEEWEEKIT